MIARRCEHRSMRNSSWWSSCWQSSGRGLWRVVVHAIGTRRGDGRHDRSATEQSVRAGRSHAAARARGPLALTAVAANWKRPRAGRSTRRRRSRVVRAARPWAPQGRRRRSAVPGHRPGHLRRPRRPRPGPLSQHLRGRAPQPVHQAAAGAGDHFQRCSEGAPGAVHRRAGTARRGRVQPARAAHRQRPFPGRRDRRPAGLPGRRVHRRRQPRRGRSRHHDRLAQAAAEGRSRRDRGLPAEAGGAPAEAETGAAGRGGVGAGLRRRPNPNSARGRTGHRAAPAGENRDPAPAGAAKPAEKPDPATGAKPAAPAAPKPTDKPAAAAPSHAAPLPARPSRPRNSSDRGPSVVTFPDRSRQR